MLLAAVTRGTISVSAITLVTIALIVVISIISSTRTRIVVIITVATRGVTSTVAPTGVCKSIKYSTWSRTDHLVTYSLVVVALLCSGQV